MDWFVIHIYDYFTHKWHKHIMYIWQVGNNVRKATQMLELVQQNFIFNKQTLMVFDSFMMSEIRVTSHLKKNPLLW